MFLTLVLRLPQFFGSDMQVRLQFMMLPLPHVEKFWACDKSFSLAAMQKYYCFDLNAIKDWFWSELMDNLECSVKSRQLTRACLRFQFAHMSNGE